MSKKKIFLIIIPVIILASSYVITSKILKKNTLPKGNIEVDYKDKNTNKKEEVPDTPGDIRPPDVKIDNTTIQVNPKNFNEWVKEVKNNHAKLDGKKITVEGYPNRDVNMEWYNFILSENKDSIDGFLCMTESAYKVEVNKKIVIEGIVKSTQDKDNNPIGIVYIINRKSK